MGNQIEINIDEKEKCVKKEASKGSFCFEQLCCDNFLLKHGNDEYNDNLFSFIIKAVIREVANKESIK